MTSFSNVVDRASDEALDTEPRPAPGVIVPRFHNDSAIFWPQRPTPHPLPELARKPIYVVDDDPCLASTITYILQEAGYRVRTFTNRALAWFAVSTMSPKPALLITDQLGCAITGLELIAWCKGEVPGLKTLLFTGLPQMALPNSPVQPDEFLQKSASAAENLVFHVRRLVGEP